MILLFAGRTMEAGAMVAEDAEYRNIYEGFSVSRVTCGCLYLV